MRERARQRVDISLGVIVRLEGETAPCLTRTVSLGGMSIATTKRWPENSIVDIEIVYESQRLHGKARVANHSTTGVGLEFYVPDEAFRRAIADLIARNVPSLNQSPVQAPSMDQVKVQWAPKPIGVPMLALAKNRHAATLIDLSLDGAALGCKPPRGLATKSSSFFLKILGISTPLMAMSHPRRRWYASPRMASP